MSSSDKDVRRMFAADPACVLAARECMRLVEQAAGEHGLDPGLLLEWTMAKLLKAAARARGVEYGVIVEGIGRAVGTHDALLANPEYSRPYAIPVTDKPGGSS